MSNSHLFDDRVRLVRVHQIYGTIFRHSMIRRMYEMVQLSDAGSFEAIVFANLPRGLRTTGVLRRAKALEHQRHGDDERGLVQRYTVRLPA